MYDVLSDHGFPEPLWRGENDVARLGNEVETEDGLNERSVDFGRPAPIIVRHGFESIETCSLETSLKPASAAVLLLERCEMLEELDCAPALLGCERDEVVKAIGRGGEGEGSKARAKIPLSHDSASFSPDLLSRPRRS